MLYYSEDVLTALLGKSKKGRKSLIIEAKERTAYRTGEWVMIPAYNGLPINKNTNTETAIAPNFQLYNLDDDIGQKNNLAQSNPKLLQKLINEFETIRGKEYGGLKN